MRSVANVLAFLAFFYTCLGRRVHASSKHLQRHLEGGDILPSLKPDGGHPPLGADGPWRHLAVFLRAMSSAATGTSVGRPTSNQRLPPPAWIGRRLGFGWDGQIGRLMLHVVEQLTKPASKLIEALPALTFFPEETESMEVGNELLNATATVTRLKIAGFDSIHPFEVRPSSKRRIDTVSSFGRLNIAMFMDVKTMFGGPFGKSVRRDKLVLRTDIEDCRILVTWKFGIRRELIRSLMEGVDYDDRVWDAKLDRVTAKVNGDLNMRLESAEGHSFAPPGVWQVLNKAASQKLKELVETSMAESVRNTLTENFSDILDDISPVPASSDEDTSSS